MQFTASLCENRDFRRMYSSAKSCVGSYVVVYARRNRCGSNRLGITASTKVGNAVVRNRARRRIRECYRVNEPRFLPGYDVVIVARSRAATAPYHALQAELMALCHRHKLLRDTP